MTLLLLELHVPVKETIHGEADLWRALAALGPQLVVYLMSFITLGIFWVGQQAQLNLLARSDRHITWIHLGFLFVVTILPFSTRLLAEFITFRAALICYWGNILALGVFLLFSWMYVTRAGLVNSDTTPADRKAVRRRIVGAQALYAFGALLCVINTYVSIAVIVLIQLHFAIGYRSRWLSRI